MTFKVGDCVTDGQITGKIISDWGLVRGDGEYIIKTGPGMVYGRIAQDLVAAHPDYCSEQASKEGEKTMTDKQPAKGSLAELDGARDYFMPQMPQASKQAEISRPKFKVGDRVAFGWNKIGVITLVETRRLYTIKVEGESEEYTNRDESYLNDAPLTPEEAWDKAAILVGKREVEWNHSYFTTRALLRADTPTMNKARIDHDKETRHQAYVILGGAHIKIGENGGPVKNRVRALIAQAQQ